MICPTGEPVNTLIAVPTPRIASPPIISPGPSTAMLPSASTTASNRAGSSPPMFSARSPMMSLALLSQLSPLLTPFSCPPVSSMFRTFSSLPRMFFSCGASWFPSCLFSSSTLLMAVSTLPVTPLIMVSAAYAPYPVAFPLSRSSSSPFQLFPAASISDLAPVMVRVGNRALQMLYLDCSSMSFVVR